MLDRHVILYDKNDIECDSMGIAVLDEHIKDDVIRETMNSNYTFEFMIEHEYANLLEGRSIIKAPTRQGEELFRVRLVERNIGDEGYSYVYCVQLFYCDMEDRLIEELELNDVTGSTALTMMSQATDAPHNFTFYSDIDTVANSYYYHKQFATALIGDLDESFINLWGGELEVNKWTVKMHKHRGENRGVKVRYRDNMTGLNAAHDYSPVVTRLYPMSADGITLDEKYVDSPLIDPNHPITKSMVFDYIYLTQDDGSDGGYSTEAEVKEAIKEMAQDMFSIGNIDKPESRYDVSLEELCRTREASHYAVLDYIFIGDTVEIQHEDWGVDISTRLIEYTYQPKTDRYLSMTLGTVTGTFSNNTQKTQESILNKIETNKQTIQGQLNAAVDHLTSLIQAGVEGHVVITENEILIMDTTDKSTAVEVWRFNSGGIGYSNTGYNGPFIGLTKDGKLVVNEATAHTLSASLMKTGLLQSADGKSWWNFDNGHFSWANGAFTFDGEQFEFKINGTNIVDTLDKSFTILASHENQVIPVTSDGKALGYGDYLFEFTVIRNYSGDEAPCMVTKITPSSKITGVSYRQNENTCSMVVDEGANLSANPDEYFDVELTILDYVLTKRITWCTVTQGADGNDGVPGTTYYTWIKYADDANGNGISNSPNDKEYIGFAYNKTTPTESNKPSDYTWSLMKGNDGLKGEDGKDGNPNYTWIKYSDYSNGKDMYNTPNEFTGYIGIAVNKDTPTEGTDPSEYTWSKFRGEDGTDGQPGVTYYTWIKYADDAQGNGISNSPTNKEYIGFAYNKTSQYESDKPEDYIWSLIKGTDGQPGQPGKDGKTYYTWIKYSDNANGSNMYDIPKATTMYIGIAVNQTTSTEGTDPSKYTWSKFRGEDGASAPILYTWIKYADDAQGSGLSNTPDGKEYIGFAYNKTTATESDNPSDYMWSLIKGTDGQQGLPGKDGKTYYTWIKYSDNSNGSGMYDTPKASTVYIGIAVNQTTATEGTDPSKYVWSKFRGDDGVSGITYYTWIKYADDASGNGISNSPDGKEYIGFAYNKTTVTESNDPSDYIWSLIKGSDGIPGTNGKDGKTYYTWIKYSDNSNGSSMYDTPKDSTKYIGIAVNQTTSTESTDPSKYTWSKFRGNDGVPGTTYYTWIKYADDASGNGLSNSPDGKEYIGFAHNKTSATESTNPSDYTWSLIKGTDGIPGTNGKDGKTYYTWIKYSDNANGSSMYDTPKDSTKYIGIAVNQTTSTESTDASKYTWSKFRGNDGVPGTTYYTWIKYADNANGSGLSDNPDGKKYIGFAYNKTSATESTTASDYMWSLIKGTDGVAGQAGKDGKTYYTWIKYSDNSNGSSMYDTPKDSTKYIGIAVNQTTSTEGTDPSKYTWSKFRGNDGVPGTTHYTWIKYADDANGSGLSDNPSGKKYIGLAYNKTTPTESATPGDYTWSLIKGEDGIPGTNGKDGKTYYTWIKYSDNSNGSGMYDTPKASTKYIGIAVNQTTSTESTDASKYTWSKFRGDDGVSATTYYTWIKYADDANGSGLSDNPSGKEYIGFAYNKTTATESTKASDYTWSLIKGSDGQPGQPGSNGKTYYTWIKYSDNANGSGMYDTPKASTVYIGIAVNQTTATESTDPSKYTWSKFRGDDGVPGIDGKDGISQKHNLIKNSAFFKGQSGWTLASNSSLDYKFKYGDHPTFHIVRSGYTNTTIWHGVDTTTNCTITELKEGVTYTLSYVYYIPDVTLFDSNLTMNTPTSTAFSCNILGTDANGNKTYYGTSLNISGLVEGVWTKYTTSFTPKKTCKAGRFKFGIAANGEVWVTDFKLEENTEASDWCGTADETIGQDGVDGQPGHDAQTVSIVASSTVFKSTDGGVTFRPGSITLTPLYQNVSHSKWVYSTNNGSSWITISNNGVSGITLNGQTVAVSYDCKLFTNSITTVQFKVISTNASVYDVITITKISERADLNDTLATMELTINQSNTAWQAAFKTSSANNLIKNSDAKFGTENWTNNGGGISVLKANAFPFYGKKEPYFRTSFPGGIQYTEDIILEPKTDYVFEGYVYVNGNIETGKNIPLHFWCYTTNSATIEACDIIDYRQNLVSGRFVKCYVHFKTKDINSNIYFRPFIYSSSTVSSVGVKRLSLKKGDRETEWCQHPNEVATAAVTISENGLKATHSEANTYTIMNATGNAIYDAETGEALAWMSAKEQWTEAKFDHVYAKNIINSYTGSYTLYVDHRHTGASLGTSDNPFSSFADLKNNIPNNAILTQDLYIIVRDPGFVVREPFILANINGFGHKIEIRFEGSMVVDNDYHAIELSKINTWVWIRGGRTDVNSSTTGLVLITRASSVDGYKCIRACDVSRLIINCLTMINTNGCALYTERTDAYTYCCDFGNSNRAVWLASLSSYYTSDDCGSCSTFVRVDDGSKAYMGCDGSPIRPRGDCKAYNGIYYSFGNCSTKASPRYPVASTPSTPPTPSGPQNYTQSFNHTSLQTYQYAWSNWSTDGSCKQGSWGYGRRGGHMFFDINAIRSFLSGTVLDGNTISLTRANSGGLSGQSNVYLCGSTCSSASGTPSYSNRTHIGTLAWGEKKTFTLPLAIVQSLKSGTCKSLAVHVDSDAQNNYINITAASITLKCSK